MPRPKNPDQRSLVIELSRPAAVSCFHVVGEVGFATRRDDIRAIVQLGVERSGRLTAPDLCAHLLGGKPPVVGVRLLEMCERLGLVEWDGPSRNRDRGASLTDEGREVAESGDVFVPERGTWTIWVTDDPLVPLEERLLRLDPFKEPYAAHDLKKDPSRPERNIVELPGWIEEACDVQGVPCWGDKRAVSNIELEPKAEKVEPDARLTLTLRVAPDAPPVVRLHGEVADRRNDRVLSDVSAPSFEDVWRASLGPRATAWNGRSLAVRFADLDDAGRADFEQTMRFPGLSLPSQGAFGAFDVRRIPLRPANDADASAWANWLLEHGTHAYVRAADYMRRCGEVRARFEGYRVEMKPQAELAAAVRQASGERPGRAYWYLQAPLDWGFEQHEGRV
jgi:hypothetical protein